jgi:imidazolonepropionase-like amidohydrolase
LPGLIDTHVHLAFDASDAPVQHMRASSDAQLLVQMVRAARALLGAGVTTARDLGARSKLDLVVQEAIETGMTSGPRLVVANEPITSTGGHCWFMGCERDDEASLRRSVREHHKAGAQFIKVMATGGFMTDGSTPWHAQFASREMLVLTEEARRLDKRVAAHAHGLEGIRNAVVAGVDTIEHCSWAGRNSVDFDDDVMGSIVEQGIFVCPTTNLRWFESGPPRQLSSVVPPAGLAEGRTERLARMRDAGVRLVAGTDAGINLVPHGAFVRGLEALVAAGFPPVEVIESATSRAAQACGLGEVTGRLEAGKDADIVVFAGDATVDVSVLVHPLLIMQRGHIWDPAAT